jgi:hypothetical protein
MEDCDHEWEKQTTSNGDGIWFEEHSFYECIKCGATREIEYDLED